MNTKLFLSIIFAGTVSSAFASPGTTSNADINGDGKLDIIKTTGDGYGINAYLGTGNGHFIEAGALRFGIKVSSLDLGDFNGDGKIDLAVSLENISDPDIWLGDGSGNFSPLGQ